MKECYFLVKAMQCCDEFPKGDLQKHEHPDFIITQEDGTRVGIELTEYYRGQEKSKGSASRRNESTRQQIADAARRLYESEHNIPLWVMFSPCITLQMKGKRVEDIAAALVNVIVENLHGLGSQGKTIYLCETENVMFENVVSSIRLIKVQNATSSVWGFVEAGFIPINHEEIQHIIDNKNGKIENYRKDCDEVWLLIVAEGNRISSTIDTDGISKLDNCKFESAFERVLFYDVCNESVAILPDILPTVAR